MHALIFAFSIALKALGAMIAANMAMMAMTTISSMRVKLFLYTLLFSLN
jgi:hypothetical protein